jgi:hypothetical protein
VSKPIKNLSLNQHLQAFPMTNLMPNENLLNYQSTGFTQAQFTFINKSAND